MPHEFFPHTGDIGLRAWGRSLEEMAQSAILGLADALVDPASVRPLSSRTLTCRAPALDLLLHDVLSELVYLFDAEEWIAGAARVVIAREDDGWTLEATVRGERLDPSRHGVRMLVKAVTYHALSVEHTQDGWQGTVILDV